MKADLRNKMKGGKLGAGMRGKRGSGKTTVMTNTTATNDAARLSGKK
tara:strand:+ start:1460 stop:1600 length:141 start_codon:yes stop_codon:yes gene_type:complete